MQKLVGSVAQDSYTYLTEEAIHTDSYADITPRVLEVAQSLWRDCRNSGTDKSLLAQCLRQNVVRAARKEQTYNDTVLVFFTACILI